MALYTVSTSGNLEFAVTGLGNPVSTFANEGIATSAIAESPISGNNPKIWTIGPANYFTSSGNLIVVDVNLQTQSGLAASALGEYPLSGTLDNIPQIDVFLGFVTGAFQSHGNLVIETSDSFFFVGNDSHGNLLINGTSTSQRVWNKESSGNILISGNSTYNSSYEYSTSGNLIFTTEWYSGLLQSGGIADYPISAAAISAGETSAIGQIHTTVISFYGNINSSGELLFVQPGEVVNSLSDSSGIAGAALADQTIGGGMDTVYRGLEVEVTKAASSSGNLLILGSDSFGYNIDSAGNLVISGTTVDTRTLNFSSEGNLVISGTTVDNRTLAFTTAGNLIIVEYNLSTQNALAASAIGEFPLGGTVDNIPQIEVQFIRAVPSATSSGNLIITGSDVVSASYERTTEGNLLISGTDSAHRSWFRTSAGELLISGNITQDSLRNQNSNGNLIITGSDTVNAMYPKQSSGNLLLIGGDSDKTIQIEESHGLLNISGNITQNLLLNEDSSGNLIVVDQAVNALYSGSIADLPIATGPIAGGEISATIQQVQVTFYSNNYTSAGNLVFVQPGGIVQELGNTSTIAGSSLAELPIAGGMDTLFTLSTFQDILNESTSGNIVITGTTGYGYTYTSAGQLLITTSDSYNFNANISTSGNLLLIGNDETSIYIDASSTGDLEFTPVGWKSTATISGSIAGSALATTPIGGDEMENNISVVQVSYISGGIYYPGNVAYTTSNGTLIISGNTVVEEGIKTAGNLIISGTDTVTSTLNFATSGNLLISGSDTVISIKPVESSGNLLISATDSYSITTILDSAGNLVVSGTDNVVVAHNFDTAGNLLISGTDSFASTLNFDTAGNLLLTGTDSDAVTVAVDTAGDLIISGTDSYSSTVNFDSTGNLVLTGVDSDAVIIDIDTAGNLIISGNTITVSTLNFVSNGNMVLVGTDTVATTTVVDTFGNLVLTGTTEENSTINENSSGTLIISGSSSSGTIYPESSSGLMIIISTDEYNVVSNITTSGLLLFTNTDEYNITSNVSTSGTLNIITSDEYNSTANISTDGNLLISGSSNVEESRIYSVSSNGSAIIQGNDIFDVVFSRVTNGTLTEVGVTVYSVTVNRVSSGNILITGSTSSDTSYEEDSAGNLIITGSSTSEYIPAGSIESSGNLVIIGSSTSQFIPGRPAKKPNQGGSYVFASSWDILQPYFKDDRHILGYVPGESDGQKRRRISGSTTFTVIRGTPSLATAPSKFDFLRNLPKAIPEPSIIRVQNESKLRKQIMLEDEMLLNGSLLDFDDPDDELNRELMR